MSEIAGICSKERRIATKNESTSDLAWRAGYNAIIDAGLTKDDIDLIIVATATPDRLAPSTAAITQDKLNNYRLKAIELVLNRSSKDDLMCNS